MSEDLIEKSKQVLANIEFNDTTYEVARNVVLDEIERLNNQIKEYGDLDNHNKYLYEENKRLNNIIKEVREHIEKTIEYEKSCGFNRWTYEDGQETYIDMVEKTLEILDKENK